MVSKITKTVEITVPKGDTDGDGDLTSEYG